MTHLNQIIITMKCLFIIFVLFIEIQVSGQVKNLLVDTLELEGMRTIYSYQKQGAQKIKEGSFQQWASSGIKITNGKYQDDKKNGSWSYLDMTDGTLIAEGDYTDNFKTGFWEYYSKGDIRLIYDHDNLEISFIANNYKDHKSAKYFSAETGSLISSKEIKPDRVPQHTHHINPFEYGKSWVVSNLSCTTVSEDVLFWFILDEWGYLQDAGALGLKDEICQTAFNTFLTKYPGEWVPAVIDGYLIDIIIQYALNVESLQK